MGKKNHEENNILLVEDKSQYYTWILISAVLFVILIVGAFIVQSYAIFDGISSKDLRKHYVKRESLNFNDLSYDIRKEYVKADSIETFNKKSVIILKEENTRIKKELETLKASVNNTAKIKEKECKSTTTDIENFNIDLQKEIVLLQEQLKSLEPYKSSQVVKKETFDKMQEKYKISIQEIEIANLSLQKELVALQKKIKNIKENRPNNPFDTLDKNITKKSDNNKTATKEPKEKVVIKEVIKEVVKIVKVPASSDNKTVSTQNKKLKKITQISCQNLEVYDHKITPECLSKIDNISKKFGIDYTYEIIPTINKKDMEIAKGYKEKSKDYLMRGLAKQRVNEARDTLVNSIGKEVKIKRVGYYVKTNYERGFIIRVLK
jgi:hypothetical protein